MPKPILGTQQALTANIYLESYAACIALLIDRKIDFAHDEILMNVC
jgi:hypothetical protein